MGLRRASDRALAGLAGLLLACGCASTPPETSTPDPRVGAATLQRPLPGDMSALYKMTSPRAGGFRLVLTTRGRSGRLVLSRQLGGALMIAAWNPPSVRLLDLDAGCERPPARAARILGLGSLPLGTIPLFLGGRIPAARLAEDPAGSGWVGLVARGWRCRVRLAADPWRVVELETPDGTRAVLDHHTASVPGRIRIIRPGGERLFALELVRLEWDTGTALPPLPELPACPESG